MTADGIGATVRHRMPGRTRIAIAPTDRSPASFERAAAALAALAAVESVEPRFESGSIIIRHAGPLGDAELEAAGLALKQQSVAPAQPVDIIQAGMAGIARLDGAVKGATGGQVDLWGLAFAGLVAGGVVQLSRGRVAGPALALFGQAATLAMARPLKRLFP